MPKSKIKTKQRTLSVINMPLIREWWKNQVSVGSSISQAIYMIRSEYGVTDFPTELAKTSTYLLDTDSQDMADNPDNGMLKISKPHKVALTCFLVDEGPVLDWLNAQSNVSDSVSRLIIVIACQFGITDFPTLLAVSRGALNKKLVGEVAISDKNATDNHQEPDENITEQVNDDHTASSVVPEEAGKTLLISKMMTKLQQIMVLICQCCMTAIFNINLL